MGLWTVPEGSWAKALALLPLVDLIISRRRSYVQQQMSTSLLSLMNTTKAGARPDPRLCPTYHLFLKCALRDIDVNDPAEMKVFLWYWEHILSKNGGFSMWHKDEIRFSQLPSECTYKFEHYEKDFKLFPASTEAFFVLLYDNCIDKWKEHAQWKHDHPKVRLPIMNKENKDEPLHKTKYTITDIGQQKYGGWSNEGLEAFNQLKKDIKASRLIDIEVDTEDEETGEATTTTVKRHLFVERQALANLRRINKKDEPKENKKRKRDVVETVVVALDLDD